MSKNSAVSVAFACVGLLAVGACTGGGAPGKKQVQTAVEKLAAEQPFLFGSDKPIIKEATCSKTAKNMFDCVTSLAVSSAPKEAHTVTVKMTKLGGKWAAQIPNIMG